MHWYNRLWMLHKYTVIGIAGFAILCTAVLAWFFLRGDKPVSGVKTWEDDDRLYSPTPVEQLPEGFIPFYNAGRGRVLQYDVFETHVWALDAEYDELCPCWPLTDETAMVSYEGEWYINGALHRKLLAMAEAHYAVLTREHYIGEPVSLRSQDCRYTAVVTQVKDELIFVELDDQITNPYMQPTYTLGAFVHQAITKQGQVITVFGWDTAGAVRVPLQPGDSVSKLIFRIPDTTETRTVLLQERNLPLCGNGHDIRLPE